jgi:hypothetical protein
MSWTSKLVIVVSLSLFGAKSADDWLPSREQIAFIEKKIHLPHEAPGPLSKYERYYTGITEDHKRLVYAELVFVDLLGANAAAAGEGHAHIVTQDQIPAVKDGGCGVVIFYFDLGRTTTPSMYCNANAADNTP